RDLAGARGRRRRPGERPVSPLAPLIRSRRPLAGRQPASRSTVQGTTLDLLWIRDGVVCFAGGPGGTSVYRAVLVLAGPAHTPRDLAAADPGALAGYRALLASLDHP